MLDHAAGQRYIGPWKVTLNAQLIFLSDIPPDILLHASGDLLYSSCHHAESCSCTGHVSSIQWLLLASQRQLNVFARHPRQSGSWHIWQTESETGCSAQANQQK